jgi:integration host factor subunit beta
MTKAELVEEVARAAELNKRDAEVIVETVFGSIIGALHKGEKVELRGFGSFRTRERGPRRGRNPKTGEPVDVPAKRVPYFKPGKELKEYFTDNPAAAGTVAAPAEAEPAAAAGGSAGSATGDGGGGSTSPSTHEGSGGETSGSEGSSGGSAL